MDLVATIGTDGALLLLSAAGLLATAVAIVVDTRRQRAGLTKGSIRFR